MAHLDKITGIHNIRKRIRYNILLNVLCDRWTSKILANIDSRLRCTPHNLTPPRLNAKAVCCHDEGTKEATRDSNHTKIHNEGSADMLTCVFRAGNIVESERFAKEKRCNPKGTKLVVLKSAVWFELLLRVQRYQRIQRK